MIVLEIILNGIVLGGMYALIGLGLNFQFGIARIINIAYGEVLMVAAFCAFFLYTLFEINPFLGLLIILPVSFVINWLFYRGVLVFLVRRAKGVQDILEKDSILATFGLIFLIQGVVTLVWGTDFRKYLYLADGVPIFDTIFPLNRLIACVVAIAIGLITYLLLKFTRSGTALRAVAVDPTAAQITGINVQKYNALAFALGGVLIATAGVLISMYLSFEPSIGMVYTMKALIVVILGGLGHMLGCLVAGIILGVAESLGAYFVDPGLTLAINYALFILILLIRPKGLFGVN